jgi:hypothetical protein
MPHFLKTFRTIFYYSSFSEYAPEIYRDRQINKIIGDE